MAYYSGNFSSFASLKSSVEAALTSNGWTLSDGVLVRNGAFLTLTATATHLLLKAGTGATGSDLLQPAPNGVKIMDFSGAPMNFPASYELHINTGPDEVYLVVNYNADRYQQLSWGITRVAQVGGTGLWFTGSFNEGANPSTDHRVYANASYYSAGFGWAGMGCGLFFEAYNQSLSCSYIHTALDSTAWRRVYSGDNALVGCGDPVAALLQALPSQFNQSTVLLPLLVVQRRPSKGQTVVADMAYSRLCRIDNHLAGETVEYGGEKWKVYPFHRKSADQRNGVQWSTGANHSGTFGYAVRYTGP